MFDIGWSEMLVIAIVIIVVVGPKELPGMLRTFGKTTAKLRVMANDFRKQFDEAMKEAELDDLKKIAEDARNLNPTNAIRQALSPMEQAAKDVRAELDSALKTPSTPAPAAAASEPTLAAAEVAKPAAVSAPAATAESPAKTAMASAVAKATAPKTTAPKAAASKTTAPKAAAPRTAAAKKPAARKTKAPKPAEPASVAAAPAKPRAAKPRTGGVKAKAGGAES